MNTFLFKTVKSGIFALLLIGLIQLVTIAGPFEYKYCDLGWKHVYHAHNESSYQQAWCKLHNGIEEYKNSDYTRVDCLTEEYAVEFDFANKWAESIGQALHYGVMTGKQPKIVLILDNPDAQMVYFKRVEKIANKYNLSVEYITDDILNKDDKGKCCNPKCKCHKHR